MKLIKDETKEDVEETMFKQIVGSLCFLCNSRPDLSFSASLVSRFMNNPKKSHMLATKRLLRYVKGIVDFGILFQPRRQKADVEGLELVGFTDSDHGGDCVERKNMSSYIFMLNGSLISWCSKKQPMVALSSCEVEYIAGSYAACQGVWLEEVLKELMIPMKAPLELKIDNVSAINLSKNPVSHGKSKHIEVKYHFLRDMVNKEE
ncbi:secreted RxLR effector protein 161-like [Vigna umbellata]|uniref:secreted RxLR effector protein 161-like n=1 Tax=Vigna umbellata TaxID=87088 RepID=UPI001F5E7CF2|nr:secreted RxLR effector protein 161-like [Vigna umbellata]